MLTVPDRRAALNRLIWRIFTKKHGITLQQDAVEFLLTKLASSHDDDMKAIEELVEYVATMYSKQEGRPDLADLASLQGTVDGILKSAINRNDYSSVNVLDYVHVVSAFDVPKWEYNPHTKQFNLASDNSKGVLCQAEDKIKAFVTRYEFCKQRLLRHERFAGTLHQPIFTDPSDVGHAKLKLSTIKSVKGQAFKDPKCLFGMLSQIVEGEWYLEDPEEHIKLDLSQIETVLDGRFVEGSFVLIEGWALKDAFRVLTMAMPPAESAQATRSLQSHPDPFGDAVTEVETNEILAQMLSHQRDARILFYSDIWLDNPALLARFSESLGRQQLLEDPPAVIVLMGRFLSSVPSEISKAYKAYESGFDHLASIISSHKMIRQSTRFIIVPGQDDLFYPNILPRQGLPAELFDSFREARIDFVSTSNPCRIKCFTREIVVMRQDVSALLERSKIMQIPDREIHAHVGQTLLDQGHLSPLPLSMQLVQWNMDHSLQLYPVPDLLCVAEKTMPCVGSHAGCQFLNPGDFYRSGLSYGIYWPASGQLEIKRFTDDE